MLDTCKSRKSSVARFSFITGLFVKNARDEEILLRGARAAGGEAGTHFSNKCAKLAVEAPKADYQRNGYNGDN